MGLGGGGKRERILLQAHHLPGRKTSATKVRKRKRSCPAGRMTGSGLDRGVLSDVTAAEALGPSSQWKRERHGEEVLGALGQRPVGRGHTASTVKVGQGGAWSQDSRTSAAGLPGSGRSVETESGQERQEASSWARKEQGERGRAGVPAAERKEQKTGERDTAGAGPMGFGD